MPAGDAASFGKSDFEWVSASGGMVPGDAVIGGLDHADNIFVGRAEHEGDLLPGKVVPLWRYCFVPYAGQEHEKTDYEVLLYPKNASLQWVNAKKGKVPSNAVPGGHTNRGETLYIGRHRHCGTLTVGKIHPSHKCFYLSYGGNEYSYSTYEVLVWTLAESS